MVRIFDAQMQDVSALVECMKAMHDESSTHSKYDFLPGHVDFILRSLLTKLERDRLFLKVAKDDELGWIVGFIAAEAMEDLWSRTLATSAHAIYVRPGYRGQLGLDLIQQYLEWAKRRADRIELQVTAGIDDERVGKLIEAYGLQPRGRVYGMEF